jgi:hypothetical protein
LRRTIWPDAGEKAEREVGHRRRVVHLHELHQLPGCGGRQCLCAAAPAAKALGRNLGHWILGDPIALYSEFEEAGDNAAAIVVGFAGAAAVFEIGDEPGGGEVRDRRHRAAFRQPVHFAAQPHEIRVGNQVLGEFVLLERDVGRDRFDERFLRRGLAVIRLREIDAEGERMPAIGQTAKHSFGLAHLALRETGCDGT